MDVRRIGAEQALLIHSLNTARESVLADTNMHSDGCTDLACQCPVMPDHLHRRELRPTRCQCQGKEMVIRREILGAKTSNVLRVLQAAIEPPVCQRGIRVPVSEDCAQSRLLECPDRRVRMLRRILDV